MKTIFTSFISAVCIFVPLSAQNFGNVGTEWYYSDHANGMGPPHSQYYYVHSVADTLIQGKTTHKLVRELYKNNNTVLSASPAYVYQDADTVYAYSFSAAAFKKFMVFNVQAGDTVHLETVIDTDTLYRLVIDNVTSQTISGQTVKTYTSHGIDGFNYYDGGKYMDMVGGLDWFTPRGNIFPEAGGPIRCFKNAFLDTNFLGFVDCNYINYLSAPEYAGSEQVRIFPNPVQELLHISSAKALEKAEIFSITGEHVATVNPLYAHVSNLESGIYFLRILTATQEVLYIRFVKT